MLFTETNLELYVAIVIVIITGVYFFRKLCLNVRCNCNCMLNDKVVIVTGANSGIGMETARILVNKGAHVILACRNTDAGDKVAKRIGNLDKTDVMKLDLSSVQSIRQFSDQIRKKYDRVDVLINNAGVFYLPPTETVDGFETTMAVNHIGPFLLTHLLLDLMTSNRTIPARVVNVSSHGYKFASTVEENDFFLDNAYSRFRAYGQSKLALNLSSIHFSKLLSGKSVIVNMLTPGNVNTNIFRRFPLHRGILGKLLSPVTKMTTKTSEMGAQTVVHVAVSEKLTNVTGKYFSDCKEEELKPHSKDVSKAEEIWKTTARLLNFNESDYEKYL